MDYTNLNDRIDLDNMMKGIAEKYPKTDDDLLLYLRAKRDTGEAFIAITGNQDSLQTALFSMAKEHKSIRDALFIVTAILAQHEIDNNVDK